MTSQGSDTVTSFLKCNSSVATTLADYRARVRTGRNRWSTSQHFRPAHAMCCARFSCEVAALVHSSTDLLGSQTCNCVIYIQPRGWIAAPCRTGLSSTYISDDVYTNMEWIKNHLFWLSFCSEPSLADRARHHDQVWAWDDGRVHWLVEHSATSMVTLAQTTIALTRSKVYACWKWPSIRRQIFFSIS